QRVNASGNRATVNPTQVDVLVAAGHIQGALHLDDIGVDVGELKVIVDPARFGQSNGNGQGSTTGTARVHVRAGVGGNRALQHSAPAEGLSGIQRQHLIVDAGKIQNRVGVDNDIGAVAE